MYCSSENLFINPQLRVKLTTNWYIYVNKMKDFYNYRQKTRGGL